MKPLYKGLIVAVLHIALVASLGAKLLYDRATRPRVWARTASYDPDLPIRGRYTSLSIEVTPEGFSADEQRGKSRQEYDYPNSWPVKLGVKDDKLIATLSDDEHTNVYVSQRTRYVQGKPVISHEAYIDEPVAFFISEHVLDPSWLHRGEELWVEVTVPKKGPPRPLRLAIKKDGVLKPLNLD